MVGRKQNMKQTKRLCNYCSYLSPHEYCQKSGEPHVCIVLDRIIFHKGYHPDLLSPEDCPLNWIIGFI
jgi:hypothetical protein